jgi:uncharacterized membrane protein YbhN (UPF0104 family)
MGNQEVGQIILFAYLVIGFLLAAIGAWLAIVYGNEMKLSTHVAGFIITALLWPVVAFFVRRRVVQIRKERAEFEQFIRDAIEIAITEFGVERDSDNADTLAEDLWRFM